MGPLVALRHALTHPQAFGAAIVSAIGWDRVALTGVVVLGMIVLTILGKIDGSAAVGFFSAVIGYVLGRGSAVTPPTGGAP